MSSWLLPQHCVFYIGIRITILFLEKSTQTVAAIAAHFGWNIHQIGFQLGFTQAKLHDWGSLHRFPQRHLFKIWFINIHDVSGFLHLLQAIGEGKEFKVKWKKKTGKEGKREMKGKREQQNKREESSSLFDATLLNWVQQEGADPQLRGWRLGSLNCM